MVQLTSVPVGDLDLAEVFALIEKQCFKERSSFSQEKPMLSLVGIVVKSKQAEAPYA